MTSIQSQPASRAAGRTIAILGMLAAFGPVATDMYLPGFHLMATYFEVGEGEIEVTLSVFFLGLALGQAIYGPLIDRFGRRGPLLAGVCIYMVSTLLCLLTRDIGLFTALRFFQAVGGCAGMIVGRAIVNDLFDERENARALSLLMMVMTLAPIIAPILGGVIIAHAGWQMVFVVMLGFGVVCGVLVWLFLPETLPPEKRRAESFPAVARAWKALLTNPAYSLPTVVGGLAQACMFAFITGSPFVFIGLYGASAEVYGFLFALIACALVVSAQINRMALKRFSTEQILGAALVLNVVAGIALVASVSTGSLVLLMVPLWLVIGSLGFIGANAVAIGMVSSGEYSGSGSSLIGVLQFGCAFAVSTIVAKTQNGTAYPMAIAIVACGMIATFLWFAARIIARKADR